MPRGHHRRSLHGPERVLTQHAFPMLAVGRHAQPKRTRRSRVGSNKQPLVSRTSPDRTRRQNGGQRHLSHGHDRFEVESLAPRGRTGDQGSAPCAAFQRLLRHRGTDRGVQHGVDGIDHRVVARFHHRRERHRRQSTNREAQLGKMPRVLGVQTLAEARAGRISPSAAARNKAPDFSASSSSRASAGTSGAPSSSRNCGASTPSAPARSGTNRQDRVGLRVLQPMSSEPCGPISPGGDGSVRSEPRPPDSAPARGRVPSTASATSRKRLPIAANSSGVGLYFQTSPRNPSRARLALASAHRTIVRVVGRPDTKRLVCLCR